MDPSDTGDGRDGLVDQLTRWLAEQRADAAAVARSRERWLVQLAQEEGSFAGVLLDLAEHASPVVVSTAGGRRHRGTVQAVAADFLGLRTEAAVDVLLAYAGIGSVRPQPRAREVAGNRAATLDTTLADGLAGLAADRPRILVVTLDGEGVSGRLWAVGEDVLTMRLDGELRSSVYLRLASVAEVSLAG